LKSNGGIVVTSGVGGECTCAIRGIVIGPCVLKERLEIRRIVTSGVVVE
jgi:hypothetical protein